MNIRLMDSMQQFNAWLLRLFDVLGYRSEEKEERLTTIKNLLMRAALLDVFEALPKEDLKTFVEDKNEPELLFEFAKTRIGQERVDTILKENIAKNLGDYMETVYKAASPAQQAEIEKIVEEIRALSHNP